MFKLITGRAGTGKTTLVKSQVEQNPDYGILCSTTGISAVNLGTTTINSILRYFDTDSLMDKFIEGKIQPIIRHLNKNYENLIIDEVSMMDGSQLDIIVNAIDQVNEANENKKLGLILVGDFAQLPPVKGKWCFEAETFKEKFSENVEFLTKIWRQDNLEFIEALNFARQGKGNELLGLLKELKVEFNAELDTKYKGTTIFAKNQQVDSYNITRLLQIGKPEIKTEKKTDGKLLGEWNKIPEQLKVKEGAYVMILANKSLGYEGLISSGFEYSNGDCGYIKEYNKDRDSFIIELVRNKQIVEIARITRYNETKQKPDNTENFYDNFEPYYDEERKRYILGWVSFHPIRLAYGITCHKSQGLTLDNAQIDIRNHFFGSPNILYVALSRARTIEGLRIVGMERLIEKRCSVDKKVLGWFDSIK